jgi:hypothetical protein
VIYETLVTTEANILLHKWKNQGPIEIGLSSDTELAGGRTRVGTWPLVLPVVSLGQSKECMLALSPAIPTPGGLWIDGEHLGDRVTEAGSITDCVLIGKTMN